MTSETLSPEESNYYAIHSSFDYDPIPTTPEFAPGSERLSYMDKIPIYVAGWGTPIPVADRLSFYRNRGVSQRDIDAVEALGFRGGYFYHPEVQIFSDDMQALIAGNFYRLGKTVADERHFPKIDRLYIASTSVTQAYAEEIANMFELDGMPVSEIKRVITACSAGMYSLVDYLSDPTQNAVIIAGDTLGGDMADNYDPVTASTFGAGGGAIAVEENDLQLLGGKMQIEYDRSGYFTLPHGTNEALSNRSYDQEHTLTKVPDFVEFAGDETTDHVVMTDDTVQLLFKEDDRFRMNGRGMPRLFTSPAKGEFTHAQAKEIGVIDENEEYGEPLRHEPSATVTESANKIDAMKIATNLGDEYLIERGVDPTTIRSQCQDQSNRDNLLLRCGIRPETVQVRWSGKDTSFNNISAGTAFVVWENQARQGRLQGNTKHMIKVMGIGASFGVFGIKRLRPHP